MSIYKSTLTAPDVCTVEQLIAILADADLQTPVMVALGTNEEGGLDVASVHSVTTVKEPLRGSETILIVPSGSLGQWFEELSKAEAAIEGSEDPGGEVPS